MKVRRTNMCYVAKLSSLVCCSSQRLENSRGTPDGPRYLTAEEVKKAELTVIRCVQFKEFEQGWSGFKKTHHFVGLRLQHPSEVSAIKHSTPANYSLSKLLF